MLPPALFRSINQRHASNEFGGRPFSCARGSPVHGRITTALGLSKSESRR
jgi:hypothetical protein